MKYKNSGEYDAIGSNFKTLPRDFRGNFWWTHTRYIGSQLLPLSIHDSDKYSAEKWILNSNIVKVYNFHESVVDHHFSRYMKRQYETKSVESDQALNRLIHLFSGQINESYAVSAHCDGLSLIWEDLQLKGG